MSDRKARARAHAKHPYFCKCGRVVHGNGAKAMHFYIYDRGFKVGYREGHAQVTREQYFELHGHPLEHPANALRKEH